MIAKRPIISIQNVTKRFPGVIALDDVSIDINAGELHAICGENGAGKSTLMKILAGVTTDYEGVIEVHDEVINFEGTRDAERAGISIIHQELNLVEELSVAANIFLGREVLSMGWLVRDRQMEAQAGELLERLECDISPKQLTGSLRVGDQQLIEIAKALSLNSGILIMDEPTSALTESEVARLFGVIARLRKEGVTILYISHKMEEIFRLSDRITVLRDGQWIQTVDTSSTNAKEVTHQMVGREIESLDLGAGRKSGTVALEVNSLSLSWPGHARQWRLQDISFELHAGEVVGVAGLMGAGRTELLECIFGARDEQIHGDILINGSPVEFAHPADAKRAGVAMVTEDRKRTGLFGEMTVGENISLCTLDRATFMGAVVSNSAEREMCRGSVDDLAIRTSGLETKITTLSGGNQQKCIIARWLLTQPQILLLDDPTRGVDVGAKAELYRLIRRLCDEGLAILFTSSELPELLTVCDRILVLSEGCLTGQFSREEATEQKIMEAATLGSKVQ